MSNSFQAALPASGQELINTISKICLWSVLLSNKLKKRNGQARSAKLIKQCKYSSYKVCLNALRAVNARWEGVGPSTRKGDKIAGDPGIIAGMG